MNENDDNLVDFGLKTEEHKEETENYLFGKNMISDDMIKESKRREWEKDELLNLEKDEKKSKFQQNVYNEANKTLKEREKIKKMKLQKKLKQIKRIEEIKNKN
jgi:hypothetical protein